MTRFFVLRWAPARSDLARQALAHAEALEAHGALMRAMEWRGVIVLIARTEQGEAPVELPHGTGFVFGVLFEAPERGAVRIESVPYEHALHWAKTGGEAFSRDHWGGYVAVLIDREHDMVHVLRDPSGAQSCYLAHVGEVRCVFSDAGDLSVVKDCAPRLERVLAFLAAPHLIAHETALEGVEELLAGARFTSRRAFETTEMFWTPPRIAHGAQSLREAACELRDLLQSCAGAWARLRPTVLHRLSGGLDSSAVLGLMRAARAAEDIVCVNECSSAAPEGDERAMARLVCKHFGVALQEVDVAPEDVRFERALDAPLMASPSMTVLSFAQRGYGEETGRVGNAILTSGQGGDQVFYRTRSTLIAAEAAQRHCAPWTWGPIAYDIARLTGKSFWRVSRDALIYGAVRWPVDPASHFQPGAALARAVRGQAHEQQMRHPWLWRRKTGPAQTARILSLIQAQHYHWPNSLSARWPVASPILSQPVFECVLTWPAEVMTHGGRDRALYRAAVADLVPERVMHRATKGQTTRHFAEVASLNRAFLRQALLDGELCASGVLDRPAMEAALRPAEITTLAQMDNMLIAFAAEAWMRRWRRVRVQRAAAPAA